MNYAGIKEFDIADGPGVRLSLFVSGCPHHCPGCFNEETWDENFGKPFTEETREHILTALENPVYQGLTLLGGEPLYPKNQTGLLPLVRDFKRRFPEKDLWCFTGYLYDRDILGWMWEELPETKELLRAIDVLVDGPFILAKKDLSLLFKGSSNQRTIDVRKSLAEGRIVCWDPGETSMAGKTGIPGKPASNGEGESS